VLVVNRVIVFEIERDVVGRIVGRVVVDRVVGVGRVVVVGRVVGKAVVVGRVFVVVVVVVAVWCPFGLREGCNSGNCATSHTCSVSLNSVTPHYSASRAYRSSLASPSMRSREPTPKTPRPSTHARPP